MGIKSKKHKEHIKPSKWNRMPLDSFDNHPLNEKKKNEYENNKACQPREKPLRTLRHAF